MWKLFQYRECVDEVRVQFDSDKGMSAAIDQRLSRLSELGNAARDPISKDIGDGILECKAKNLRFLYFFQPDKKIIVVLVFKKKSQKTPKEMKKQAIKIRDALLAETEMMNELTQIH